LGFDFGAPPFLFWKLFMKISSLARFASPLGGWLAVRAHAHEGHGIETASHWHATDTVGLLVLAAVVGLVVWFTRGGK
jgi:hypothetical protein